MPFPLTLVTTNVNKQVEWQAILDILHPERPHLQILQQKQSLLEIQSDDLTEIAIIKAIDAWMKCGKSVLVEDVSFSMVALRGFPGPYYAPVEKMLGRNGIHALLDGIPNRDAVVSMTIAYVESSGTFVSVDRIDQYGTVPDEIRGDNGHGWDPLFMPKGQFQTYAQMLPDYKNTCSFRRQAIEELISGKNATLHRITESLLGCYFEKRRAA